MNINTINRQRNLFTLAISLLCLLWSHIAVGQTGTVLGFGQNSYGQIGDGTFGFNNDHPLPTPALQISGVKAVACGVGHTLALDANGTVWAWGVNGDGELGTGDTAPRYQPVPMLYGVKAIAAGDWHSLALKADGTVYAWGYNGNGQLGLGWADNAIHATPTQMNSVWSGRYGIHVKAIAAGSYHSLALTETGALYGCGSNGHGQLAQSRNGDYFNLAYMRSYVTTMAGGGLHTLVQTDDNQVYGVGYNSYGQLGNNSTQSTNTWVYAMSNVRAISAGFEHSLAIRQDGQAFAWGRNDQGQLGTGDVTPRLTPAPMVGAVNIKAVAAGWDHSLVLTAGGTVRATGDNVMGELGNGTTDGDGSIPHSKLMPVKNAAFIGSIAAWGFHSVMLKPYNVIYGTGLNNHGQLGLGHLRPQKKPLPTANLNSNNYIAIATGSSNGAHTLALRADGIVVAWGYNAFGQLGNGTFADGLVPAGVKGPNGVGLLSNIIAIAAGDNHSLALAADGTVYAWGDNRHGQLGIGNFTSPQPYPVHVLNRSNVFAIAAGAQHSLLLSDGGWVYTCGLNDHHQLGTNIGVTGTSDSAFFGYCGPAYQIAIAAGASHSLSLDGTGGIYAWGRNDSGQLGYGSGGEIPYPIYQPGTAAIALAAGGDHSQALNGAEAAWDTGGNSFGELGLGDTTLRYVWTNNMQTGECVGIASGLNHSLFRDVFGNLYASGLGTSGQLGNGATVNQTLPFYVMNGVTGMAGGAAHTLILTTPAIQVASVTVSPISVKGGANATGTVTLNGLAGPGGQRVTLWVVTDGAYVDCATVPAYVDVAPGSKTATFPITTKSVTKKAGVYIAASLNVGSAEAPLAILP